MIWCMSETPIYDQTVNDQGFNPLQPAKGGALPEPPMGAVKVTLSPEQAEQVQRGSIGGASIRKGGRKR